MIGQRQHILDSVTAQRHSKRILCELGTTFKMYVCYILQYIFYRSTIIIVVGIVFLKRFMLYKIGTVR